MTKKIKLLFILSLTFLVLTACSKDSSDTKSELLKNVKVSKDTITTDYGVIKLGKYKDLEIPKSETIITDTDTQTYMYQILQAFNLTNLDDSFYKNSKQVGVTNEKEFLAYSNKMVNKVKKYDYIWNTILTNTEVKSYNQDKVDEIVDLYMKKINEYVKSQNITLADYLKSVNMTEATIKEYYETNAKSLLKDKMINYAIAKKEDITLNEDKYEKALLFAAFESGYTSIDKLKKAYTDTSEDDFNYTAINYYVVEFLSKNVKTVEDKEEAVIDQLAAPTKGDTIASITVKDVGIIKIRLFDKVTPKAVENFTTHSKDGYYNNLIFHRVISDFMIQGGDPLGTGQGGESIYGEAFEDEFSKQLIPVRGALCMANSGVNTNGSQFFIVQTTKSDESGVSLFESYNISDALIDYYTKNGGTSWLYRKHTVFGQVYEGMDVVDKIAAVSVDANSKPDKDVVIEKIEISTFE